ncbi:peptidase [Sulfurifustis variabilis]|uniref:Peptidase n=1 Tax=Sulfurifustis variabilis TaxID=1675686 RepID=A0A1B4V0X2_9GAMM|nr:S9 family peptidase [Sulfurifustis variabilis]BAU47118.1 peptidase [Sulfurifustis variabilis]
MPGGSPYGSWKSPITADLIVSETVGLGQVLLDGDDVYWSEQRPAEGGRNAILRARPDGIGECLPAPYSARTRVHEYGGGAFAVAGGIVYFTHFADQRVYRLAPGGAPVPLTSADARRYADLLVDRGRRRLIAVCEDHRAGGEPVNSLVAMDADRAGDVQTLASGHDFFASPCLGPDGQRLAWLAWDHPDMPWDAAALYVAQLDGDGRPREPRRIAGGANESVFQPSFGPDGLLYFVSDRTGWWNLYRHAENGIEALAPRDAEFGLPQWVFGLSTYAFSGRRVVCAWSERGESRLGVLDPDTRELRAFALPYTDIGQVRARAGKAYFTGATRSQLPVLVELELDSGRTTVLHRSTALCLEPGYLSKPEAIEYETANGERAHAFYYGPRNHDVEDQPAGEKPPLLVLNHGGPTAAASSALSLRVQYWTSRGFAVLDVNYRGSTGYGREYRERLYGRWGVADVEDCVHGTRHLIARGLVDPDRVAIRGGSAGGFTALCALTFHTLFRAGASYYGVSDLEALARDTHKFEARYLDRLVGPYPGEQERYRKRSPIHHVDRLARPVIFFQGAEDRVVPPDQTERLVAALHEKRVPVAYVLFQDEAHGFRRAANIKRALEAELYFYSRLFGFTPADAIPPVPIAHLR